MLVAQRSGVILQIIIKTLVVGLTFIYIELKKTIELYSDLKMKSRPSCDSQYQIIRNKKSILL